MRADQQSTIDLMNENEELRALLAEARLQIEYLQDRFRQTGSGNGVLAKINAVLGNA